MAHSRHVGTHIQKDKRRDKITPAPQTKKRSLIATANTYEEAQYILDHSLTVLVTDTVGIRRIKQGFGIYYRTFIVKKEKVKKSGATGT